VQIPGIHIPRLTGLFILARLFGSPFTMQVDVGFENDAKSIGGTEQVYFDILLYFLKLL